VAKMPVLRMKIVIRSDDRSGLVVLPGDGWLSAPSPGSGGTRVSPKEFENLAETLGAFVALASHPACSQAACQSVARAHRKGGDPTFIHVL
jgi:hypothetical protein